MSFLAYLDPGTGSVLIQALIGVAVGAGVLIKAYWHKIRGLFGGKKKPDHEDLRGNTKTAQKKQREEDDE